MRCIEIFPHLFFRFTRFRWLFSWNGWYAHALYKI